MLELADRWVGAMVAGFANHPGIAAWDLGDDPARVARPRRAADLAAWLALVGEPFRARGDRVHLTLGAEDVIRARGTRLAALAPHADRIDIAVRPGQLRPQGLPDADMVCFLGQLAQALAGPSVPMALALAQPSPDPAGGEGVDEPAAAAIARRLVERQEEVGLVGLRATRWCDLLPRLGERAPFDRDPWLLRCGLTRVDGSEKPVLQPWAAAARVETEPPPPSPWPATLDVEAYYSSLPESLLDLAASWRREHGDQPGILDRSET